MEIRIVLMCVNKETGLPKREDIPENLTRGELAECLYRGYKYDSALPQDWLFECLDHDIDARGRCVWIYPNGFIFGTPAALDDEFMHQYYEAFEIYPVCPVELKNGE